MHLFFFFFCPGSGPDGRVTRKDIESFTPPKAAPVGEADFYIHNLPNSHFLNLLLARQGQFICTAQFKVLFRGIEIHKNQKQKNAFKRKRKK